MDKFKQISLKPIPSLDRFLEGLEEWGDIGSLFYEPKKKARVQSSRDSGGVCSEEGHRKHDLDNFIRQVPYISDYKGIDSLEYRILNRLEFVGSLATRFLEGGVYGRPPEAATEAMHLISSLVQQVFPWDDRKVGLEDLDEFYAYKIEGYWCNLTTDIPWSYVVHDANIKRWWLVYFRTSS